MAKFGRKKNISDYVFNKGTIFVLGAIVIFLLVSIYERYVIEREMSERRTETESNYSDLLERKDNLEKTVEYLRGDRGVEEAVRKNFDVAKAGEQVVVLVGEPAVEQEQEDTEIIEYPWYIFWR